MTQQKAINQFLRTIAVEEAGKTQANIGDLRQALKLINKYTDGMIYAAILAIQNAKNKNV